MIKVIVVEDEYLLRTGLIRSMPWGDYGCEVVGEADCADDGIRIAEALRPDIVIERITGDGSRTLLIEPKWILHKHKVLNTIRKEMKRRNTRQGIKYV